MKSHLLKAGAACVLSVVCLSAPVWAMSPMEQMRQIDANSDFIIQFTEIYDFRARIFDEKIDMNENGLLDLEEQAAMEARIAEEGDSSAMANLPDRPDLDKDEDGVVTREEFVTYLPPRVLSADRNGDKRLVRSELRNMRR